MEKELGREEIKNPIDAKRHASQRAQVLKIMLDGKERTLQELAEMIDAPTQSIGTRLRELRKEEFGSYYVVLRRLGDRLHPFYLYRLVVPTVQKEAE